MRGRLVFSICPFFHFFHFFHTFEHPQHGYQPHKSVNEQSYFYCYNGPFPYMLPARKSVFS